MSKIKFGPAGLGPVDEAVSNLKEYSQLGLKACEIAFTYGVYIKDKGDAIRIGKVAKDLGVVLSIHAPYFINLNSKEEQKIKASRKRILDCCKIGHYLGARNIVFHPGFYSGMSSKDASLRIKKEVKSLIKEIKENKWDVELCPEVMGKKNVFGSIDEIADLMKDTGCSCCIDFAHILAQYNGDYRFDEVKKSFKHKKWHCHFSGIEYGDKGEKRHLVTPAKEWKKVLGFLNGIDKDVVIINESPSPIRDSVVGLNLIKI